MIALVLGVFLFGGIHAYAYTTVFVLILAGRFIQLIQSMEKEPGGNFFQVKLVKTPFDLFFVFLFAFFVFQIIPLPPQVLKIISPESLKIGLMSLPITQTAGSESNPAPWFSIAPYAHPVRLSLVRLTVYWLLFSGLVQILNSRKRINTIVIIILCTCCFESLYGIVQTFSGSEHIWWFKKEHYLGNVTGTYINHNHFAGLMEMGLLLAAGFSVALSSRSGKKRTALKTGRKTVALFLKLLPSDQMKHKRFLILFSGVVMGIGLIYSNSRGGMISAGCVMLLTGMVLFFNKKHRGKGIILVSLFILLSCYAIMIGLDAPVRKFSYIDSSFTERVRFAKKTLDMARDYPIVGTGIGGFKYIYPRYKSDEDVHHFIRYAHNDWAQFQAEAGIVGMCLLVSGIIFYLFKTIPFWMRRRDLYAVSFYFTSLAVLLCLGIHSLSDFNLHFPGNCVVLVSICAAGYSALYLKKSRRGERMLYPEYNISLNGKGMVILGIYASIIVWTGGVTIRHFMAETYCHTVRNTTLNRNTQPLSRDVKMAIKWDRYNAGYWYKLASALTSERDQAYNKLKHQRMVIEALETAVRLNPCDFWQHMVSAQEYTYTGKMTRYYNPWLTSGTKAVKRADYFVGNNINRLCAMGNFWVMVSKEKNQVSLVGTPEWNKALMYYKKAIDLEANYKKGRLKRKINRYIWSQYHDTELAEQVVQNI